MAKLNVRLGVYMENDGVGLFFFILKCWDCCTDVTGVRYLLSRVTDVQTPSFCFHIFSIFNSYISHTLHLIYFHYLEAVDTC